MQPNFSTILIPVGVAIANWGFSPPALAASPVELMGQYAAEAAITPSTSRGEAFFAQKHGREWSCSTCHGAPPTRDGAHAMTRKRIAPLAPAFNPEGLNDRARADKWFRRNCGDVLGRDCTPAEKADVLAYLTGLRK